MKVRLKKVILITMFVLLNMTPTSSFYADEPKEGTNAYLGELPNIINSFALKVTKLHDIYKETKNDEDKKKLEEERDVMQKKFKETYSEYIQTESLIGNELPFKVVSKNLPFEVLSVKINRLTLGSLYFFIKTKVNNDIKKPDSKFSKSISIHFVAVDSEDMIIPNTWNWATTQGGNNLEAGVISDAKGHWNTNRVKNMKDFDYIKIMSKADYKEMKKSQKRK